MSEMPDKPVAPVESDYKNDDGTVNTAAFDAAKLDYDAAKLDYDSKNPSFGGKRRRKTMKKMKKMSKRKMMKWCKSKKNRRTKAGRKMCKK